MRSVLNVAFDFTVFALVLAFMSAFFLDENFASKFGDAANSTAPGPASSLRASDSSAPVIVARVESAEDTARLAAIATARARRSVTLFPGSDGMVEAVHVAAGEAVEAGRAMITLRSADVALAVEIAKVRLTEAETALARAKTLQSQRINAKARGDDAELVLARAALELKRAEEALDKRTLRAPFDGVAGLPKVEAGDRVAAATPLVTLDDRSALFIEFEAPEQDFGKLERGRAFAARTPSFPDRVFEGRIDALDTRVDPVSRQIKIRAKLDNADDALRPGMSFSVEMVFPGPRYAAIPELALQWRQGEGFVWRIDDGVATRAPVRLIRRRGGLVLVEGDVKAGDLVVREGVQRLRSGRAVRFVAPNDETQAARAAKS